MKLGNFQSKAIFFSTSLVGAAALLACFGLAGCGGDKTGPAAAGTAQASSDKPDAGSTDKSASKTAEFLEKKGPAPTMVGEVTVEEVYPNKKVQVRRQVKRFSDSSMMNSGAYASFYLSGEKLEEGNYVEGKKDGPWKMWYENGQLAKTENYNNGLLEGQWSQFDSKGVKHDDVSFKNGKRDGRWTTYGDDGKQILQQDDYTDGKPSGTSVKFSPDGKKVREEHYENGQQHGLQQYWFPNGQLSRQVSYKDGKLDGKLIRWNEKGEKQLEEEYANGKLVRKSDAK